MNYFILTVIVAAMLLQNVAKNNSTKAFYKSVYRSFVRYCVGSAYEYIKDVF